VYNKNVRKIVGMKQIGGVITILVGQWVGMGDVVHGCNAD